MNGREIIRAACDHWSKMNNDQIEEFNERAKVRNSGLKRKHASKKIPQKIFDNEMLLDRRSKRGKHKANK